MTLVDIVEASDTHDLFKVEAIADYVSAKKFEGHSIYATILNGDYDEGSTVMHERLGHLTKVTGLMNLIAPQLQQIDPNTPEGFQQYYGLMDSAADQLLRQYLEFGDDETKINDAIKNIGEEKKEDFMEQIQIGKQIEALENSVHNSIGKRLDAINNAIGKIKKNSSSKQVLGTLGNHDLEDETRKHLTNLTVIDGEIYNLNGIKIFGHSNLTSTSAYSQSYSQKSQKFLYDQTDYAEKFKDEKIDIAILHNGISLADSDQSMSGYQNHSSVENLIKQGNTSYVFGGHTHRNKVVETEYFKGFSSSHVVGYKHTYDTDTKEIVGTKALLFVPEDLLEEYSHILKPINNGSYYQTNGKNGQKLNESLFDDNFYQKSA